MSKNDKPILAVTMGDPAGIGPEITVKALAKAEVMEVSRPVVIGSAPILQQAMELTNVNMKLNLIKDVNQMDPKSGVLNVLDIGNGGEEEISYGQISAVAGDLAFRAVRMAIDLAMNKVVDGTVTGPIHKESINLAGHHFSGHTEIYAHYTGTKKYAMLLAHENFRVIHVTTHVALREACNLIKTKRVLEVIKLMDDGLRRMGIPKPRIGVAGLNPHSSDGGLFGDEEEKEIAPAIREAVALGINAEGPVPPDTLFALAYGGKYDGCVAMYHDQGHIPFKFLGFAWDEEKQTMKSVSGVNITLGLPIIRTSVDHGTAFEIAGKGLASPDAMVQAIRYATMLLN